MATDTLLAALLTTARLAPHRGITLLDRRGQRGERRTYSEFPAMARARASQLAACGITAGDRVLICLPTSWDLIELYFGAIYLGAHPILIAPTLALGGAAQQL